MLRVNIELGEAPFGGSPVRNIHTLLPPFWPTVPGPLRRSGISALGLIERGAQRRCPRRLGETGQSSQEWLLSSARPRVTVGRILSRLFSITMPPSFDGSGCWLSWQPRFNAKCVVLYRRTPCCSTSSVVVRGVLSGLCHKKRQAWLVRVTVYQIQK